MCEELNPETVLARLNTMVGQPYEPPDGCLKFLRRALLEFGIEIEGTNESTLRDARHFKRVVEPSLGTVAVFENIDRGEGQPKYHVALMLGQRWAIQSSVATNGVARIEITRFPWSSAVKGFYRPRGLK